MTLIDYTPFYYSCVIKKSLPSAVVGKFVQIAKGNELYVILSPREFTKYHANIVERFCMDKGIEGRYDSRKEKFFIQDQSWQIIGGGKFERDANKKAIKFSDNSMAYGRFRMDGMKEMLAALKEFDGYTIVIE